MLGKTKASKLRMTAPKQLWDVREVLMTGCSRCKAEITRYVQVNVDAAASGLLRAGAAARLGAHLVEQSHPTNQNWSAIFVTTHPRRCVIEHPRDSRPFALQKSSLNVAAEPQQLPGRVEAPAGTQGSRALPSHRS